MDNIENLPFWEVQENYLELVRHYLEHPIALYTGAGVSMSSNPKFGVGEWNDFVRKILLSDPNVSPETVQRYDRNLSKWEDEPWKMAEWVARKMGRKKFKQCMTDLVQREENFQIAYKLLAGPFLKNARTLNAIAAFCADFAGGKIARGKDGRWRATYDRAINRRVHSVVTSNYDPFLEAASATMFRHNILKPVAAEGSSVGNLLEIPVFHIHGYVRFPYRFRRQEGDELKPFTDLVITTSDYLKAWESKSAYNPTMGPQIHILRHYTVLFIGFSFRDWKINELLKNLNTERSKRKDRLYHYTIMRKKDVASKGKEYFENILGVKPIMIDDFPQIRDLLSHLYQQGLNHDYPGKERIKLAQYEGKHKTEQDKPVFLSPAEYFEELYRCRLCGVQKKKSYVYNDSNESI